MKQILATLNNDFFYLVKEWLESVNSKMNIDAKGKIEIKYLDGHIYLMYPLNCTIDKAKEDVQWVDIPTMVYNEDNKIYVGRRYNDILADMYEFQMDSYLKGVL